MRRDEQCPLWWERILTALLLGGLGLVTGILSVWMLTNLPGVEVAGFVYLAVGSVVGVACFVCGFLSERKTIDALGEIWMVVWKVSSGVLRVIRSLAR